MAIMVSVWSYSYHIYLYFHYLAQAARITHSDPLNLHSNQKMHFFYNYVGKNKVCRGENSPGIQQKICCINRHLMYFNNILIKLKGILRWGYNLWSVLVFPRGLIFNATIFQSKSHLQLEICWSVYQCSKKKKTFFFFLFSLWFFWV